MFANNRNKLLVLVALTTIFAWMLGEQRLAIAQVDLRGSFWQPKASQTGVTSRWISAAEDQSLKSAFRQPNSDWGAGHRGIDLAALDGDPLLAPVDSTIELAKKVFGRDVIVLRHSPDLTSEFEPACLLSSLKTKDRVSKGEMFGRVCFGSGKSHCSSDCFHWGVRTSNRGYLSPQRFLEELVPSRLKPTGEI